MHGMPSASPAHAAASSGVAQPPGVHTELVGQLRSPHGTSCDSMQADAVTTTNTIHTARTTSL
jgi:hypothetical protein